MTTSMSRTGGLTRGLIFRCLPFWLYCGIAAGGQVPSGLARLIEDSEHKLRFVTSEFEDRNPLRATELPKALDYVRSHRDYKSYFVLMVLRKHYPDEYKRLPNDIKAAVLCSALKNALTLNDWSVLGPKGSVDKEAAHALIETGEAALKYLTPLLGNDKAARLSGSADATVSVMWKYRRKDFAYRYASLILKETPRFRPDPEGRDIHIEILKAKLKNEAASANGDAPMLVTMLKDSPSIAGRSYRCADMIQVVNHLRRLGKAKSLAVLREYLASGGENDKVLVICRLLFVNPTGWQPPVIGIPLPVGDPKAQKQFPLYPIAISNGVPFLLVKGYEGAAVPESAAVCLRLCKGFALVKEDYALADYEKAARALTQSEAFRQLYQQADRQEMADMILRQAKTAKSPKKR